MSGHGDSIREWRARESWKNGGRAKTTLGLLVAQRLLHLEEQEEAIRKVHEGRLAIEYFRWNGRTDCDELINTLIDGGVFIGVC